MGWLDSTTAPIDTDGQSVARIDLESTPIVENSTIHTNTDTGEADTGSGGGGFFVLLKRNRTITRWKYVGLTQTYAESISGQFYTADTIADTTGLTNSYGVEIDSITEARARRTNNANGWDVNVTTDTSGPWVVQ